MILLTDVTIIKHVKCCNKKLEISLFFLYFHFIVMSISRLNKIKALINLQ